MTTSAVNRRRAILLPLGLLMLSLAVFGWGLEYKLSLYHSENATQQRAPEAKLLSQKERPAAGQAIIRLAEVPVWPVVLLVALAFSPSASERRYLRYQRSDADWLHLPAFSPRIFVRPPPAVSFPI